MNHFLGESFSYEDIEDIQGDPNLLYVLNVRDQYRISAVTLSNDIKIIVVDREGNPVDINGKQLNTSDPSVISLVSRDTDHLEQVIKSQMLSIADDLMYNITEEVYVPMNDIWDALKRTDPFSRGWSTNPQDAIDALEELGFLNISTEYTGVTDPKDQVIQFEDDEGNEGEIFVSRIGRNTFQYNIVSPMYDEDHDDLSDVDEGTSIDDIPQDEKSINKYLTLKYHFLDQGYSEKDAEKLAVKNLDKDTIEECDLSEASVSDQVVTIGIYGDYTGEYESLESMISAFKKAGIQVSDIEGDEDYGWEMNLTGNAKTIYKMVDDRVPGYSCDSVQEFIDEYSISEGTEDYDDEDDYPSPAFPVDYEPEDDEYEFEECDDSNLIKESPDKKYYVLIGYNSYPEAGIEGDDINPIMVLGADNEAEAESKCNYIKQHLDQYPEASTYDDLFVEEVDEDYIEEYFGYDYLEESNPPETLDVHKHKVGDKVSVSKKGMTSPEDYKVGDTIKIGKLNGTIDKIYPDKFDITITYNDFLNEDRLPDGYYTLGDGKVHKVPTTGYSKWYRRDDAKYRYNNAEQCLEYWYDDELVESYPLSFMDWIENPDYWIDYYREDAMSYAYDFDPSEFGLESKRIKSKSIKEAENFVIAYREGGQDKYSSVNANSSQEALQIFNAAVDKAGRNVSNAHIAVEDVTLTENLPPMKQYDVVRVVDGDPTVLTTLEARNDDEAQSNTIIALLDAGYYYDEVEPEVLDGTIRVQLHDEYEDDEELMEDVSDEKQYDKKIYKIEYKYNYEDELPYAPWARSATFIGSRYVRADSTENAIAKVVSMANEIANNTPGMVGNPYDYEVTGLWDTEEDLRSHYRNNRDIHVIECDDAE